MRTTNTFGIHFVLRMYRGKNGKAAIYVRIVVNKSRCEVALKRMVDLADWSKSKGLAKPKNETLKSLNSYLEQARCAIASHYQEFIVNRELVAAEAVKNNFSESNNKRTPFNPLWITIISTWKKFLHLGQLKIITQR